MRRAVAHRASMRLGTRQMDSFEFNKIAGAVLSALLVIFGSKTLDRDRARPSHKHDKAGYTLPVPKEAPGGGAAAPAAAVQLRQGRGDCCQGHAPRTARPTFKKCMACHTPDKGGPNRVGPNLWGVVGRKAGTHAGFAYSDCHQGPAGVDLREARGLSQRSRGRRCRATRWCSPASRTRPSWPTCWPTCARCRTARRRCRSSAAARQIDVIQRPRSASIRRACFDVINLGNQLWACLATVAKHRSLSGKRARTRPAGIRPAGERRADECASIRSLRHAPPCLPACRRHRSRASHSARQRAEAPSRAVADRRRRRYAADFKHFDWVNPQRAEGRQRAAVGARHVRHAQSVQHQGQQGLRARPDLRHADVHEPRRGLDRVRPGRRVGVLSRTISPRSPSDLRAAPASTTASRSRRRT